MAVGVDEARDGRKPGGVDDLLRVPLGVPDSANLVAFDSDGSPVSPFPASINDGRVPYQKIEFLHIQFLHMSIQLLLIEC